MISYTEREVIEPGHLRALSIANEISSKMPTRDRQCREIRCHELARVVSGVLGPMGFGVRVVDGTYAHVEHSWIELLDGKPSILDVYAVGRLPQVQLFSRLPILASQWNLFVEKDIGLEVRKDVLSDLYWIVCEVGGGVCSKPMESKADEL